MIELLSLPRRPKSKAVSHQQATTTLGLPMNSLPGWETIPLNFKLPMLKCPDNQVIFSKDKIGQSLKHLKQDFDPSGCDSLPEYNPLHDSNLKTFYANDHNLKRLRLNGEITQKNDVICTLKDFNDYRQQIHKSHVYYLRQELNRLDAEQRDRLLISNAEAITIRDMKNVETHRHNLEEIAQRRLDHDQKKRERFERFLLKTEEKFQRIAGLNEMKKVINDHKKTLHGIKMQHHKDVAADMQRKRQISIKKLFQIKNDRKERALLKLKESQAKQAKERQIASWEKRLEERIANQTKMNKLLQDAEKRRNGFIDNHRLRYELKWAINQNRIQRRASTLNKMSLIQPRKSEKKKKKSTEERVLFCPEYQASFEQLLDEELCDAINASLDMEVNVKIPFNPDDPIYKAAKFIMQHIITKFDKDLNDDRIIFRNVYKRISKFFDEAKRFVIFRATQIIAAARGSVAKANRSNSCGTGPGAFESPRRSTLNKSVSFCKDSATIGTSSYAVHPQMDVREVADRTPTPAGSLASIVVDSRERLIDKNKSGHMCRNDMVFVEHFVIKFKRELIVGISKRVFSAIECHFDNKIMDVRKELLEIDHDFLVCQATKSILGYARNSLNFESILKLCNNALATDIVWSLQKQLLRPKRDPRGIIPLHQFCSCDTDDMKLCLYCHQ